jgi:hypothetical protein
VPIGFPHNIKNTAYEFQRNVRVKKIAHRIDEDLPPLIPPQRLVKYIRLKSNSEIISVPHLPHGM